MNCPVCNHSNEFYPATLLKFERHTGRNLLYEQPLVQRSTHAAHRVLCAKCLSRLLIVVEESTGSETIHVELKRLPQ